MIGRLKNLATAGLAVVTLVLAAAFALTLLGSTEHHQGQMNAIVGDHMGVMTAPSDPDSGRTAVATALHAEARQGMLEHMAGNSAAGMPAKCVAGSTGHKMTDCVKQHAPSDHDNVMPFMH